MKITSDLPFIIVTLQCLKSESANRHFQPGGASSVIVKIFAKVFCELYTAPCSELEQDNRGMSTAAAHFTFQSIFTEGQF